MVRNNSWGKLFMWFLMWTISTHCHQSVRALRAKSSRSFVAGVRWLSMKESSPLEASSHPTMMRQRNMVTLPKPHCLQSLSTIGSLRVQQFNVLADGLSGLRPDLGAFSRVSKSQLDWSHRRYQLLHEIVQYNADVVTLQECDHFHDFFLPEMHRLGYTGYFAPKPTSTCLEVSDVSDGCAIFIRRSKLDVVSVEVCFQHRLFHG